MTVLSARDSKDEDSPSKLSVNPSEGGDPTEPRTINGITYISYTTESQLSWIVSLMRDLSEPYSIYTYRYFLNNWPELCWLALDGDECVGAILCKQERHKGEKIRGYIAMLAVDAKHRGRKIGSELVVQAINVMKDRKCEEVMLETEAANLAAQQLYRNLGFVRDKLLLRYYLNGMDAFRLKLWL